jgi:hypothetical protein
MIDIYDIVQDEIFANIDATVEITAIVSVGGGSTVITLCKNKWIRVNQVITDTDSKEWLITSIAANGDVTVTDPAASTPLTRRQVLTIKAPQFLFGTHWSATNEYTLRGSDSRVKLPLVWLVENISEEEFGIKSSIERQSRVRLYFLDDNNPKENLNADFRLNVVTPMIGLKDAVIEAIKGNLLFDVLESWNTRNLTRFGNENEKGYFENILDENLSGVELVITLPIFKRGDCKC